MVVHDYTGTLFLSKATVRYRNPRYFKEPKEGADYVYTNHSNIAKAYADIGVPEYKEGGNHGETKQKQQPEPESSEDELTVTPDVQPRSSDGADSVIPEDFENLNFFKKRSIAQSLTDEPVRTKEDVERVISRHR